MIIPQSPPSRRVGFALLLVLIMAGVSILILAGVMYRGHTVALLNQRNNDYNVCANAAEAAVEKAFAQMAYHFAYQGIGAVNSNLSAYAVNIPLATENSFWKDFVFSDGLGHSGRTYVAYSTNYNGPLPSAYAGLFAANSPVYRIVSNVTLSNSQYNVVGTAQEDVLLAMVPLTTWAIFYNGLLEFTQCATMIVNGRVHANGNIYVGTTASLLFNNPVDCTGTLTAPQVDGLGSGQFSPWNTTFNDDYTTNVGSVTVSLNMTNSHFLIDIPPGTEDPTSTTGKERLYNKAQMVLTVTNAPTGSGTYTNPTVKLVLQNSVNGQVPGDDPTPVVLYYTNASTSFLSTNLPFLSLTNITYDQREKDTNLFTQIDVGRFASWVQTNATVQNKLPASSGIYPTILFVADRRAANAKQLPAVRLKNGDLIPGNNGMGFSVVTPNPLYVWGNYNVKTSTNGATAISTTNTANTFPAALLSDALTVLSSNWVDSQGFSTYSQSSTTFDAADTTINAAIITGTVASTGTSDTTFSGGVHNLPRLLEDWSSKNLWLNTSILRLWNSQMATNQFRNPAGFSPAPANPYYNPPTRHYSFDLNFLNPAKVPPGIPVALVPIRFGWGTPPPNTVTYTPAHN